MCQGTAEDIAQCAALKQQSDVDPQSSNLNQNSVMPLLSAETSSGISDDNSSLAKTSVIIEQSPNAEFSARKDLRLGTLLGSLSLALLVASSSLTLPHMQSRRDSLGCDSLCLGSMTSARSALSLIGSAMVGRMSDSDSNWLARTIGGSNGRKTCLYIGSAATMTGLVIAAGTDSIRGMWLSMIPGALLQQNFSVTKAVLSDYHEAVGASSTNKRDSSQDASARAGSVGKLGMAVGLAFMAGPLAGATFVKTYDGAVKLGLIFTLLSLALASYLPRARRAPLESKKGEMRRKDSFFSFLDVKVARTSPALFIMSTRVCMALSFHIFQIIWTVSLKSRFDFGPADHGQFMSFIGLTYAISQGFVAKKVLKAVGPGRGRIRLMQACCMALGLGRYLAFQTTSLLAVYVLFAFIIMGLGVLNTILTADVSGIATSDEIGGLFGILEAVESMAGMLGPLLGGALALMHPVKAPLYFVVGLYGLVFLFITIGYEQIILSASAKNGGKKII